MRNLIADLEELGREFFFFNLCTVCIISVEMEKLSTTSKRWWVRWELKAGWSGVQRTGGGRIETTAGSRLRCHRAAVWLAFSHQPLPQPSHAMRLTELSAWLSVHIGVCIISLRKLRLRWFHGEARRRPENKKKKKKNLFAFPACLEEAQNKVTIHGVIQNTLYIVLYWISRKPHSAVHSGLNVT